MPDEEYAQLKAGIAADNAANGYDNPWSDFKTKNATMVFTLNG